MIPQKTENTYIPYIAVKENILPAPRQFNFTDEKFRALVARDFSANILFHRVIFP